MIKRIIAGICVFVMVLAFSGCSLNFFSVESLMSPPTQSGKNGEVQKAFQKLMSGKNIQLRTPVSGDYQTSFIIIDINGDENEEALVFYTDSGVDASIRMALLECVNDTWVISSDVKGPGSGIYDVSFEDINNDGVVDVFVGWSLFDNQTSKIVSVYDVVPGEKGVFTIKTLGTEYYNYKSFVDFNDDGEKDLVLVSLDDSADVKKTYFRCFSISGDGAFVKYSEIRIDSAVSSVLKIQEDKIKENDTQYSRVFIDCLNADGSMFTEMLYWDSVKLKPVRGIKKPSKNTLRNSKVFCRDIDGDGKIEVPVNIKLYGDEKSLTVKVENLSYTFNMVNWLNVTGDKSEGNITTVFNPITPYFYRVTRNTEITVKYDAFKQAMVFCIWDEEEKAIKDELLSISYANADYDGETYGKVLYSDKSGTYYYHITSYGEDFGLTDEGVMSSFIIIE
ncbi:MAG: hypothetical protein E7533_01700 [Ruminococcaceae bacterium]|nr:hypothetical protein [Oscillospiraceae bacterium]